MLRRYTLSDGSGVVDLCKDHRDTMVDQVSEDLGRVIGAKWKCSVCTLSRRFAGKKKDSDVVHINGYVVVCTPAGATYCTCRSWRYQKIPPDQRTCKHIEEVYGGD